FFSSRRRHTRSKRDWSSDVCSSDLFLHHIDNQIIRAVVDTDYLSLIYIIARFNQKDSAVLQSFQRITGYLTLFQSNKRTAGAAGNFSGKRFVAVKLLVHNAGAACLGHHLAPETNKSARRYLEF